MKNRSEDTMKLTAFALTAIAGNILAHVLGFDQPWVKAVGVSAVAIAAGLLILAIGKDIAREMTGAMADEAREKLGPTEPPY